MCEKLILRLSFFADREKMVSRLPHEFRKYVRNSLHLSRILEETKKAMKDIDAASIFPGGKLKFGAKSEISRRLLLSSKSNLEGCVAPNKFIRLMYMTSNEDIFILR